MIELIDIYNQGIDRLVEARETRSRLASDEILRPGDQMAAKLTPLLQQMARAEGATPAERASVVPAPL